MTSTEHVFHPTVASEISLASDPIIDGKASMHCDSNDPTPMRVEKEVELFFHESDFTWLVFVSQPVDVKCVLLSDGGMQLQVVNAEEEFIMRVAIEKLCTSNQNPIYCHQEQMDPLALHIGQGRYFDLIRAAAPVYPGRNTSIKHSIDENDDLVTVFDWDAALMLSDNVNLTIDDLLVFALPHHTDILVDVTPFPEKYCAHSLIGPACLVKGSTWKMIDQKLPVGFRAPRPISSEYLPMLLGSLQEDLRFRLPKIYREGYGDTYFSGKMLAKLARICMVAEEVRELCKEMSCITPPSDEDIQAAVDELKRSVEIWINGNAGTPFVYDASWGGVVSCGCEYNKGSCVNEVPNCPAFYDPGLNFGNAYYVSTAELAPSSLLVILYLNCNYLLYRMTCISIMDIIFTELPLWLILIRLGADNFSSRYCCLFETLPTHRKKINILLSGATKIGIRDILGRVELQQLQATVGIRSRRVKRSWPMKP
jgi:hypothetical protein